MSLGQGGLANKILEDEETVIYEYGGYCTCIPESRNENRVLDGSITIPKSCFAEPEIHEKIKKMPSGRRKPITKRIPVDVDYRKMIADGLIQVENCGSCWQVTDDGKRVDVMACLILSHIFREYQETGEIPERIGIHM